MSQHEAPLSPLWVAAVAMVNKAGLVLMQQRLRDDAHGGLWEFPGGKLDPGEAPAEAAARELFEELGVRIEIADLEPAGFASGWTDGAKGARSIVILLFACTRWQGEPQALAAAQLAWCEPLELAKLAMPPLDYPLAEGLLHFLA